MEDSLQRLRMDAPATNDNGGSSTRTPNGNRSDRGTCGTILSTVDPAKGTLTRYAKSVRIVCLPREDQRHGVRVRVVLQSAELLPYPVLYSIFNRPAYIRAS